MSKYFKLITLGKQKTIKKPINFLGHTRQNPFNKTKLRLSPNQKGITFKIKQNHSIKVHFNNTKDSQGDHTTCLSNKQGSEVKTVEHLLSALCGTDIDSVLIELDKGNEIPILDHTSQTFVKKIIKSGTIYTPSNKQVLRIEKTLFFEHAGSLAILKPSAKTTFSALIQFDEPIGEQYMSVILNKNNYSQEIAWARPFIRENYNQKMWKRCRKNLPLLPKNVQNCPIPVFKNGKWIVKVKSKDEPVRHKILDLIGDLATLGTPILGHITVIRPGHDFNRKLVNFLGKMTSSLTK